MIVKILSKSATFKGVKYNTSKVEKDKGELMKVQNFGALQAIPNLRPKDYINYLEAVSSRNKMVKFPQLHAVISCKGQETDKKGLTELAEKWLEGMGYGSSPYLLIFHKDTGNNHIHMVSTRIGPDGKKISDSYEKLRAYQVLHQVMGYDKTKEATRDIENALSYQFSTRAQFRMILESKGYTLLPGEREYKICKYGKVTGSVNFSEIDERISAYQKNGNRIYQIRAIIDKYKSQYSPAIYEKNLNLSGQANKESAGYTSELAEMLAEKFGIQVLFHAGASKPPYGFSILDHAEKIVFKGGDILPLQEFIGAGEVADYTVIQPADETENIGIPPEASLQSGEPGTYTEEYSYSFEYPQPNTYIGGDVDDEAVYGRKRNRKLKGRSR